jgi:putative SOS response-associated peptidase YedK
MCGRFTLATSSDEIARIFDVPQAPEFEARYNIAPTQDVPACRVLETGGQRQIDELRWGLVPFWADDLKIGNRMINARSETAASKPAYRAAFKRRRCLVPATGFLEWKKEGGHKQPYLFRKEDGSPFALAGLWERWSDSEAQETVETFTILTCDPNELVARVHNRMPVILPTDAYDFWLDPTNDDTSALEELLGPYDPAGFESVAVSRDINSPHNDRPELLDPID